MAVKFNAQKAVREKIYTKTALISSSGGGKSYSALRLATGMAEEIKKITGRKAKILMGNTESGRGRYYANEFDYDLVDLEAPYNPELFVDFINYAVSEGYDILILDSSSAEWEGKGGCLELQQQAGGKYQDWSKISPRHDKFIQAIAMSPIHVISTMRSKDQYEVDKDDKGKVTVRKLGVAPKQREGFEYEFTCTFMLDGITHTATAQKDNTHIFENDPMAILTEEHGRKIIRWANSGEAPIPKKTFERTDDDKEISGSVTDDIALSDKKEEIASLVKSLIESGVSKEIVTEAVKKNHVVNGKGSANYNSIKDITVAQNVLSELETLMNK